MSPYRRLAACLVLLCPLLLAACAGAERPVLYPDNRAAKTAIEQCIRLARAAGAAGGQGREIVRDTAMGAAVGGAASGIYGAVRGYGDAGESAAAGAVAGASVGLIRGLFRSTAPAPTFQRYVERCLAERGHAVIGWR